MRRGVIGLLLCLALAIAGAIGVGGCVTEKYSYLEIYGRYEGEIEQTNAEGATEKKSYELKLYLDGTYEAGEIKGDGKGRREYGSFRFSPIALENYRITVKAEVAVDGNGSATETDESVFGTSGLTHVQTDGNRYGLESEGIKFERTEDEAEDTIRSNALLGVFGGTIDEDTIDITVEESVDRVKVDDFLYFSPETEWSVYYDYRMTNKLSTKVARLERGDTELYLTVGEEEEYTEEYTIDIFREYESPVVFESEGVEVGTIKVAPNGVISEGDVPTVGKTGYKLVGWKDEAGKVWKFGEESAVIEGEYGEHRFIAVWEPRTYNAVLKVDGETFSEEEVTYNSEYGFPTPEKVGHTFSGWSDGEKPISDSDGKGTGAWLYAEDKEITAQWTKKKYTVTVISETSDGGELDGDGEYEYGDEAEISVTTENGYTFAGWYADGEKITDEKTVKVTVGDGDVVLTAKFEEYFLGITVNGAKGNSTVIRERVEGGTEIAPMTFITKAPEGIWDGWYENDEIISEDEEYSLVMPRADKNIEARWVADGVVAAVEFLEKIAENEDIELTSDVDFTGVEWSVVPEYFGSIVGNGYALKNITVNAAYEESGVEYVGLFANFNGSVTDVTFENVTVEVTANGAIFGGLFAGKVAMYGYVDNVTVSGKISVTTGSEDAFIGGFAGENEGGISNVSANCRIDVSQGDGNADIYVGGFVGKATATDFGLISDCYVSGTLVVNYSADGNTTVTTDDFAAMVDADTWLENNTSEIEFGS